MPENDPSRRAVVTGLGAVTPIGNDHPTFWANAVAGKSGGGPITHFDAYDLEVRIAAEVVGFRQNRVLLMPLGEVSGIEPGNRIVVARERPTVAVGSGLRGRVLDGLGQPIDGGGPIAVEREVSLYGSYINPLERPPIRQPLDLGVRAINTMLTSSYIDVNSDATTVAWAAALALLVALGVLFFPLWVSIIVSAVIAIGYFIVTTWQFSEGHIMNVVYPLLAIVFSFIATLMIRYFTETRQRARVSRRRARPRAQARGRSLWRGPCSPPPP